MELPTVQGFINNVVKGFVVRPLGAAYGIDGFLFDVIEDEEVRLEAEATDHFIEDNSAIQDHVALRPIQFTLKGYVSELNTVNSQALDSVFSKAASLGDIAGLAPEFSAQANQIHAKINNVVGKIDNYINQANNIFDIFSQQGTSENNQQKAFAYFLNLWQSRQLCNVETPYKIYTNMVITMVSAIQRGDTNMQSMFAVTFKEIRTAQTLTLDAPIATGRAGAGLDTAKALGQLTGREISGTTTPGGGDEDFMWILVDKTVSTGKPTINYTGAQK